MVHHALHHAQHQPSTSRQLFQAWCEAAKKWRQLRSDPTLAACVAARAAWYTAIYGNVPPVVRDDTSIVADEVPAQEDSPPDEATKQLDIGQIVRLTEKARALPAYRGLPASWFGVITGTYVTPTGRRRFLVDPHPVSGGWNRMYVREEWLELVPPSPPSLPAPATPHTETARRPMSHGIESALGIGDRVECVNHRSYTDGGGVIVGFEEDAKGRRRYGVRWASGTYTAELRSRVRKVPSESEVTS